MYANTSLLQSPPIVANASSLQQQSSSSSDIVTAQVVSPEDNPPIISASNSTYLLVTFGNATNPSAASVTASPTAGPARKRQAAAQPLVYNATQSFSAVTGGIYNLSAIAADAQNGDSSPNCALTICGGNMCGPSNPISTSFAGYSYAFHSASDAASQVATFSIQCVGQAYVALDNVTVTSLYTPPAASGSSASTQAAESSSNRRNSLRTYVHRVPLIYSMVHQD